jgi:hypothetical protein
MNFGACAVRGTRFGRAARIALNARDLAERLAGSRPEGGREGRRDEIGKA